MAAAVVSPLELAAAAGVSRGVGETNTGMANELEEERVLCAAAVLRWWSCCRGRSDVDVGGRHEGGTQTNQDQKKRCRLARQAAAAGGLLRIGIAGLLVVVGSLRPRWRKKNEGTSGKVLSC